MPNLITTDAGTFDLDDFVIETGNHYGSPENGFCVMELAAYVAGRPHSDNPPCVSGHFSSLMIQWNDAIKREEDRQFLKYLIPYLIGTYPLARDGQSRDSSNAAYKLDFQIEEDLAFFVYTDFLPWLINTYDTEPKPVTVSEYLRSLSDCKNQAELYKKIKQFRNPEYESNLTLKRELLHISGLELFVDDFYDYVPFIDQDELFKVVQSPQDAMEIQSYLVEGIKMIGIDAQERIKQYTAEREARIKSSVAKAAATRARKAEEKKNAQSD